MADFDVARARRETPGCERVLHFNNAGASLLPNSVRNAVIAYLNREADYGPMETAEAEAEALQRPYVALAEMLACTPEEIALTENATRAWAMAFHSLRFQPGDRILTGYAEYGNNTLAMQQAQQRYGVRIEPIPDDEHGQVSVAALREMLDERVKLIAITHVPTDGGLVNPAAEVGKVAQEAGILYLLDVCQSTGQMPLDVRELRCDMLAATGRKYLRAPRSTGFLYVRRDLIPTMEPPIIDYYGAEYVDTAGYRMRDDARRFETYEANCAGRVGLGVAVDYALAWGLEAIRERITYLAETLRARLTQLPGVMVRDLGRERCGIVTFTTDALSPNDVRSRLLAEGIHVKVSTRESSYLDMDRRGLPAVVRASLHYFNTEAEIERICTTLNGWLN